MIKNKIIFVLAALSLFGCSKKAPHSLYERWEQKLSSKDDHSFLKRKLASSPANACMKDVFSVDTLKEEVAELEKAFPVSRPVSGQWRHLDLSRLPVPQANFLSEFGDKIGDLKDKESIDYSMCEDVPCIFNKIYGKSNSVEGYVHYIWYLKFRSMLAADNLVPKHKAAFEGDLRDPEGSREPGEYGGSFLPLSDFLFTQDELYAFWRLSHVLKNGPHTTLTSLKEIQRIPRGKKFLDPSTSRTVKVGNKDVDVSVCGLAYSIGWILLTEGCLRLDKNNLDQGNFYHLVAHEISHHVDFHVGKGLQGSHRSKVQDYIALSGLELNEYKDPKITTAWVPKPGATFVSDYAKNSPVEHFAETMALYRVDGDITKEKASPDLYSFFSSNFYNSLSYEKEELIKRWISENRAETERAVLKVVIDCSQNSKTPISNYLKLADFRAPALPQMISCYSYGAEEISQLIRAKVLIEEADGCNVIKDQNHKKTWDGYVKGLLVESFEKYLQEMSLDKNYLARIKSFYKEVEDDRIAMNAFLTCYEKKDEELCFNAEIKKYAEAQAQSLNLNDEITKEMSDLYVSHHAFGNVKSKATKFYQSLVLANLESIQEEAGKLWSSCASQPQSDGNSPRGRLFSIGDGYLVSSFYNCINESLPETAKAFVREVGVDNFKLQHSGEEQILLSYSMPVFVDVLKKKYEAERSQEKKEAFEYTFSDEGKIRANLLSDLSWVKRGSSGKEVAQECGKTAMKLIKFKPLFHLKNELFTDFVHGTVCSNLEGTKEFKALREKENTITKMLDRTEFKMRELATLKAKDCLIQYPMGGLFNKMRYRMNREACLTDPWSEMEEKVLSEMKKEPDVIKTSLDPQELRARLEWSRRQIQQDTIKTHFAIF